MSRSVLGAVEDDPAVEHLDAAVHAGRDVAVVGDDHDGHPQVVEFLEEPQDGLSGRLVEVAGGLVGEHDGRAARPGLGRWPPAGAARPRAGWAGREVARPGRPVRGRRGRGRAARPGVPRRRGGRRPRCRARSWCSARKNCWNTKPIRVARSAASSRSESRSTSRPVTRTCPELGRSKVPIRCNSVVLPDPDGPTMPTSSPWSTAKETPRRAVTGGSLG